jgi:hypothetical protein
MFAKAVVFFFALVTFVNAAPIIDYTTNPSVRPLPDAKYEIKPVPGVTSDIGISERGIDFDFDLDVDVDLDLDFEWHLKRETVNLDTLCSSILNGLKSNGLDEYVEHFSTRIQRLKDLLASGVSHAQITAEANNLLLEYKQVLDGLKANKSIEARGVVNPKVLAQLKKFVDNAVKLLRFLGRSAEVINTFLSEIEQLKVEVQNGTLDVGDLLSAARDILLSFH